MKHNERSDQLGTRARLLLKVVHNFTHWLFYVLLCSCVLLFLFVLLLFVLVLVLVLLLVLFLLLLLLIFHPGGNDPGG